MLLESEVVWTECLHWLFLTDIVQLSSCSRWLLQLSHSHLTHLNVLLSPSSPNYAIHLASLLQRLRAPFHLRHLSFLPYHSYPPLPSQHIPSNTPKSRHHATSQISGLERGNLLRSLCFIVAPGTRSLDLSFMLCSGVFDAESVQKFSLRVSGIHGSCRSECEVEEVAHSLHLDAVLLRRVQEGAVCGKRELRFEGLNCLSAEGLRRIMEAAPSLEDLSVAKESVLQRVKLDNTPESLKSVRFIDCGLKQVDIGRQLRLKTLTIVGCRIKRITVDACPLLEEVDLRANVELDEVKLEGNSLVRVDLGCCPSLVSLELTSHSIVQLDLRMLDALKSVTVVSQSLQRLYTDGCTSLNSTNLECPHVHTAQ